MARRIKGPTNNKAAYRVCHHDYSQCFPGWSRTLKRERIKRHIYASRAKTTSDLFDYIDMFCNRVRRHGSPGSLSLVDFERRNGLDVKRQEVAS
ncbi:IS3 family transposase [Burkholderia territorii]|uniref:IS3 family transposase n=1 Tax=Burkholderia territorii TaxID=1503055 RepID=UPI0012D91013